MITRIIVVLLFSLVHSSLGLAQAQQPKKVARIGYLASGFPPPSSASPNRNTEAFYQGLREVGYILKARTWSSNIDMPRATVNVSLSLLQSLSVPRLTSSLRRAPQRSWLRGTRPLQFLLSCYLSAIPLMRNSSVACRDRAGISLG